MRTGNDRNARRCDQGRVETAVVKKRFRQFIQRRAFGEGAVFAKAFQQCRVQRFVQLPGIEGDAGARLPTAMTCNNMEAVLAAAIGCMGLAWMPDFLAADALADGRLVRVLPRLEGSVAVGIWALHAPLGAPAAVPALLAHLRDRCCGPAGAIPVHACGCSSTTPLRTFSAAPRKRGRRGLSRNWSCCA